MSTAELGLPDCGHTRVFRQVVAVMQADATLSRVIASWWVWDADMAQNLRDPAVTEMPAIRLTPAEGGDDFYGPAAFLSQLMVMVEVFAAGTDADDAMNLYDAARRSLYPADDAARTTIHDGLLAAGAQACYLLKFSAPGFRPAPTEGDGGVFVRAVGGLSVPLVETLNP